MSSFKRSLGLIQRVCKSPSTQLFHTTSRSLAVRTPSTRQKRVQSVPRRATPVTPTPPTQQIDSPEDCLPPENLLQSAHKSGGLLVEPSRALEILREYQRRAAKPTPSWEKGLCDEFSIQPETLAMLGRILNRCASNGQRLLGKGLVLSASKLGDFQATFELVESAYRTRTLELRTLAGPRDRLALEAKTKDNPQAMVLHAKILFSQAKRQEALEWFAKAVHREDLSFYGASEAFVFLGLTSKNHKASEAAFRKAALDLDDPLGYLCLAQIQEEGSSEREIYFLKAATSGIAEAMHELGVIATDKLASKRSKDKEMTIEDYGLAREWFQAGAAAGWGPSMVQMGTICKTVGQDDVAAQWLERSKGRIEENKPGEDWKASKLAEILSVN